MIKTEQTGSWEHKVNFIDENDVFVGYDLSQSCCENADYAFLTEPRAYRSFDDFELNEDDLDLTDYIFDVNYFEDLYNLDIEDKGYLYEGGQVFFRMIADNKPDLYLTLYNSHNGYYSHGFKTNVNGETGYSL